VLEIGQALQSTYLEGGLLVILGRFLRIRVDFEDFRVPFFPFLLFFNLETRYTRTAEGMLMYSPCGNSFQAGQLGPSAYRLVQTVD
jgi:hypothetical protein